MADLDRYRRPINRLRCGRCIQQCMVSGNRFVLGAAAIRPERTRFTFPQQLVTVEVVAPGEQIVWAVDEERDEALIGRDQDWLGDRGDVIGMKMVTENRMVTVPRELFERFELFETGETVFFVADAEELRNDACRVLTEDDMLTAFDQEIVDRFKPE
ncbi:hypothetical protein HTZ84_21005 [Haloterrigena sp. SYSU A558-1]|uniref:SpoVT-AbrB domain-containing protein n=1 Tax=Haloterrigena gelatinilytica TaxID=2741724 RepID=A0ABX2LNP1_9EURY|nr:hypothetical protein [Haloterrigena gelatinilytica]NUC74744.1 hypothetical protein [Haloterrigena gelatinilytica]